jgi:ABC-type sugar transport system ATPase subunit
MADFGQDGEWAIEAQGLVKRFDGFTAVDGVDIRVPRGAIYGILGPNGAGKTTTLRMLLGIIDPDEGRRVVLGHERPTDIARRIGYLPEERGLYPAMKATEAIAFLAALRGCRSRWDARGAGCWKSMASPMPPIARSASSRKAWPSRCSCWARWSTNPIWWSSTSRSRASTRSTRASSKR